jgi:tetratricopeptide (TPR) repeat protein
MTQSFFCVLRNDLYTSALADVWSRVFSNLSFLGLSRFIKSKKSQFIRYAVLLLTFLGIGESIFVSGSVYAESVEKPKEANQSEVIFKNPISFQLTEKYCRLYFSSSAQAALAVFKKGTYWWFVFDKKIDFFIPGTDLFSALVSKIEKINATSFDPELTVIQLELKPNITFSVDKDKNGWFISFSFFDNTVLSIPPAVNQRPLSLNKATWSSAVVGAIESPKEIYLTHEGKRFYVLPSMRLDDGLRIAHQTPYFELGYSVQGFACQILSDRLFLEKQKNQLVLKAADVFSFSTQAINPPTNYQEFLFFNSGSTKDWVSYRKDLERRVRESTQANVPEMQMERVWVEVALGQGQEAKAILGNLKQQYPGVELNPFFKAIEGMAFFLCQNYAQALETWAFLNETTEIQLWKAVSRALLTYAVETNSLIICAKNILDFYPPVLRNILTEIVLKVAASIGETSVVETFTSSNYALEDKRLKSIFDFYKANILEIKGSMSAAMAVYKNLLESEQNNNVPLDLKAEAKFKIILDQFSTNALKIDDVIKKLDKLRSEWKEGQFEFRITKKLIELLEEKQSYPEMLEYVRFLKKSFPERSIIENLNNRMQSFFIAYFKQDLSNKSPLKAITVYENFLDLVPNGSSGNELMNIIVNQFLAVDLLDQAAHILAKWAAQKPDSPEKNDIILRVAEIHLLNKNPETTLTVLGEISRNASDNRNFQEKKMLIEAEALAAIGKMNEALFLLKDSMFPSHLKLAGKICMQAQQWNEAAHKLSVLVGILDDRKDTELKKNSLLSLAISYYLGKQTDQLQILRQMYGEFMKDSNFFQYLTKPLIKESNARVAAIRKIQEEEILSAALMEALNK